MIGVDSSLFWSNSLFVLFGFSTSPLEKRRKCEGARVFCRALHSAWDASPSLIHFMIYVSLIEDLIKFYKWTVQKSSTLKEPNQNSSVCTYRKPCILNVCVVFANLIALSFLAACLERTSAQVRTKIRSCITVTRCPFSFFLHGHSSTYSRPLVCNCASLWYTHWFVYMADVTLIVAKYKSPAL